MTILERVGSEWTFLRGLARTLRRTTPVAKNRTHTLRDLIEELAAKFGDRVALMSDTESLTYRDLNGRANRYARWAASLGIGKGDVVALLMPNRPEYLAIWIGIAKVGGVTALLNTNLSEASLAHCVRIVGARTIIVDASLLARFETAQPHLDGTVELFSHGDSGQRLPRVDQAIDGFSADNLPLAERVPLTINDRCIFVYTSGTHGAAEGRQHQPLSRAAHHAGFRRHHQFDRGRPGL